MTRIAIVDTMGGLGDLLLALPLIEAVARTHPHAETTVITTAPWQVLLERDDRLHEVVPVPGRDGDVIRRTVADALERLQPDLAITTNRQHGLPELLRATSRRAITDLWRHPPADELVDLRMLRVLVEEGVVAPELATLLPTIVLGDDERAEGEEALARLVDGVPVLLLPDSGMPVKRWPLGRWTELARRLRVEGRAPVVVSEVEVQRSALRAAGAVVAPELSLRGLAALAAAVGARGGSAVGGDTGPVRLAAAVGVPVVGLFGPSPAARYGYRGAGARDLQGLPGCPVRTPTAITEQECWWSARCPLTADHEPGCMADLRTERVLAALIG